MWIALHSLRSPRANPPGVWVLSSTRNRLPEILRAPQPEVDAKLLPQTGRAGVRIPSFDFQFLPTPDRMSHPAFLVIRPEHAGCVGGGSI